jgi:general secretion pathway protein F
MRYSVIVRIDQVEREIEFDAEDESALIAGVRAQGMIFVSAAPVSRRWHPFVSRKPFDRSLFTQELIALLEAGLSLIETIETLRDKTQSGSDRAVIGPIAVALYEGQTLSQALARQPGAFPALYVATAASAERTGHLAEALKRYHHYDARLALVRKKIQAALVYPAVVLVTGGLIIVFLLFYVIPKFSQLYASMKNLPAAARLMLWWGDLVDAHGKIVFAIILAAAIGMVLVLRAERVRKRVADAFWQLPRLRHHRDLFVLTRFYRTLGLLLAGGMPVVESMRMSSPLLPAATQTQLGSAMAQVESGRPLSTALAEARLTTPVSERLLRVGEQSGELATMIARAADFCDEELERAIDTAMRLVEPLLMLVVGMMVGVIVFLLYTPIFELAGNVGA